MQDDDDLSDEIGFTLKKSVIIDEWRKRCYLLERKKRIEAKSVFKASNLRNRLEAAFQKKLGVDKKDKDTNLKKHLPIIRRGDIVKR